MMTMRRRSIGLLVVGFLVAGCGSSGSQLGGVTTADTARAVTTAPVVSPTATSAMPTSSMDSDTVAGDTTAAASDALPTSSAVLAGPALPDLAHGSSPTDLAVAAIDLRSGTTLWTIPKSDDLRGSLGVVGEQPFVFVQSGYCDNNAVVAVDKEAGATIWRTPPDLAIAEVNVEPNLHDIVFGDVLVAGSNGGGSRSMVGVDTATGTPKWTGANAGVLAASPSALVTWSALDGGISVLDPATGTERWNVPINPPADVATSGPGGGRDLLPAVTAAADADLVYIDVDNVVTAYDATGGAQRWTATMNGSPSGPANLVRGGDVLLIEDSGGITALDPPTGTQRWSVPTDRGVEQLSLGDAGVADGNLYLPGPPTVAVINLANGMPRWQMPPEIGSGHGLVAAGGGHVVVQDQNQRLHLMDAATGAELWDTTTPTDKRMLSDGATYRLDTDAMYLTWSCGGR